MKYVGITLLCQQPGRGISFSHTYELYPLNRRPSEPSGWIGDGAGLISLSRAPSISQYIQFTKGVLFLWWEQSIEHCYPDESNSIKRALHLGPRKEGLSEASCEGSVAAIHPQLWEGKINTAANLATLSPFSCLLLSKRTTMAILVDVCGWVFNMYPSSEIMIILARINKFLLINNCIVRQIYRQRDRFRERDDTTVLKAVGVVWNKWTQALYWHIVYRIVLIVRPLNTLHVLHVLPVFWQCAHFSWVITPWFYILLILLNQPAPLVYFSKFWDNLLPSIILPIFQVTHSSYTFYPIFGSVPIFQVLAVFNCCHVATQPTPLILAKYMFVYVNVLNKHLPSIVMSYQ